jgi:hypothetical protein
MDSHPPTGELERIMTLRRKVPTFAAGLANFVVTLNTVTLLLTSTGCSRDNLIPAPAEPVTGIEVVGTLVAVKDDRPVDGGVDLTLETAQRVRELVRVPSLFIAGPRDSVAAMHEVVNAAKLGDRLRARGTRDEAGALRAEVLELLPR